MRSPKTLMAACAGLALLAAGPAAYAGACKSDSDCAKNQLCASAPCATAPCEAGKECPPPVCPDGGTCEDRGPGSSCSEDANCPSGFVCEVVGASACSAPGCEAGQSCPPAPPCEPEEFSACVPAPCKDDAECGDGLSCITFTYKDCAQDAPACAPGASCEAPPPPPCEATSRSMCAPPYVAPCAVDADCGEGFNCTPLEQCSCSGGGSVPTPTDPAEPSSGAGSGEEPPASSPESQCSCAPTGENYCAPKEIDCKVDSECPANWSCEAAPAANVTCVDAPPDAGGSSGSSSPDPCPPLPSPSEVSSRCVPPAWSSWGGPSGSSYQDALGRATGGNATDVEAARAPSASSESGDSGGCAIAGSGPSPLLLLGLLLVARRRRTPRGPGI